MSTISEEEKENLRKFCEEKKGGNLSETLQ